MEFLHNLRSIFHNLKCGGAFKFHKIYLELAWKQVDWNAFIHFVLWWVADRGIWTGTHKYWAVCAYFIMKHMWYSLTSKIFLSILFCILFSASLANIFFCCHFFLLVNSSEQKVYFYKKVLIEGKLIDRRVAKCLLILKMPRS